ncbi:MAG: sulfotransferase [Planctomycetaceae bacterium]|nr:sulfotransferase [Planctomycetaceae bacterium]
MLSTGRVGTDTLTRVLALSPGLRAHHEPEPTMLLESRDAYQCPESTDTLGKAYLNMRYFSNPVSNSLRLCWRRDLVYVETSNRLTYFADRLADYFPLAKFVFLHRNPPDVIRSAMRRGYYNSHPWDPFRITPRMDDPFLTHWEHWTSFEKCCWYWQAVNRFSHEFVGCCEPDRCFVLPFECIKRAEVAVFQRLFDWLDVASPRTDEIRAVLDVRHNQQETGEFPKWADWTYEQKRQMDSIIADVARTLGYGEYLNSTP